jgi:presenilin-like A22 family membrane protease
LKKKEDGMETLIQGVGYGIVTMFIVHLLYIVTGVIAHHKFFDRDDISPLRFDHATTASAKAFVIGQIVACMTGGLITVIVIAYVSKALLVALLSFVIGVAVWSLIGISLNPSWNWTQMVSGFVIAAVLVLEQYLHPHWLLRDVIAGLVTMSILMNLRKIGLRTLVMIGIALVIYDALNVYGTGFMIDAAQVQAIEGVPMAVEVPKAFSIGNGDIILPGLWIMLAFRMAKIHGKKRVVVTTMLGNVIGWGAAFFVLVLSEYPVPALVCLIPCTAVGYLITAVPQKLVEPLDQQVDDEAHHADVGQGAEVVVDR